MHYSQIRKCESRNLCSLRTFLVVRSYPTPASVCVFCSSIATGMRKITKPHPFRPQNSSLFSDSTRPARRDVALHLQCVSGGAADNPHFVLRPRNLGNPRFGRLRRYKNDGTVVVDCYNFLRSLVDVPAANTVMNSVKCTRQGCDSPCQPTMF